MCCKFPLLILKISFSGVSISSVRVVKDVFVRRLRILDSMERPMIFNACLFSAVWFCSSLCGMRKKLVSMGNYLLSEMVGITFPPALHK